MTTRYIRLLAATALLFSPASIQPVQAQSLDDYKAAAGSQGCYLIPYSGLRDSCRSSQDDVERLKQERFKCGQDLSKSQKDEIYKRIEVGERMLDKRKQVRDRFIDASRNLSSDISTDSKADAKPFIETILSKIRAEMDGHAQAIQDTEQAIFNCRQLAS